ncbi:Mu-like prophage protein Com [Solidesulfovibrio carbinoliphilus subsp. oakridgensis]|uniref:Mu-like prophage protein Com n=1 Tax=Solidesulfovibrio carbinoliphilus subsp. oakridgensis TaxID=694327 RepID=G7Q8T0_9BACT|nr:Com family DNA-binding transcriptional regulator [Solidesulfovibrio carbinoliphilus]EHJ47416.1 Mu-like prophage protein Com [Solidesulfovibrio carbinoliphilus subsp. oakridgensis]
MREIRCGACNRLLAKGEAVNLSIKCPRCGTMNLLRATSPGYEPKEAPSGDQIVCRKSF